LHATDLIMKIVKQNHGMITSAMVVSAGISRGSLKYLFDKDKLKKASRGVYILPEVLEDELLSLQSRFKRGIFSNSTALFLLGLSDRTPHQYDMTFPSTYNLTKPKDENVKCTQNKEPLYSMGVVDLKSLNGNTIKGYCTERTLCDILRPQNHVDIQIVVDAYKRYAKRSDKDIPKLSKYAKILRVEKRLRPYLEVLL
jgi:hypothetical protein